MGFILLPLLICFVFLFVLMPAIQQTNDLRVLQVAAAMMMALCLCAAIGVLFIAFDPVHHIKQYLAKSIPMNTIGWEFHEGINIEKATIASRTVGDATIMPGSIIDVTPKGGKK